VLGGDLNTLLSIAVLTGLPRMQMPLRRVFGPALLVAADLELLKTVGQIYVHRIEANPTYQVVAGSVGLLVFLNVVNHLVLFAAALTAPVPGVGSPTWPLVSHSRHAPALTGVPAPPPRRRT